MKSLGTVLATEDLTRVREAYSLALVYIRRNETEFLHLQPRRLRTRLAHLVIRLAQEGECDGPALSEQAVSALRGPAPRTPGELAR